MSHYNGEHMGNITPAKHQRPSIVIVSMLACQHVTFWVFLFFTQLEEDTMKGYRFFAFVGLLLRFFFAFIVQYIHYDNFSLYKIKCFD